MDSDYSYTKTTIDLGAGGRQKIDQEGGFISLIDIVNASGVQQLDGLLNIQFGSIPGDPIPFRINSKAKGYFRSVLLTWPIQPGWTAILYQSRGRKPDQDLEPLTIDTPPVKQLVTAGLASNIATAAINIGTSAVKLADARSTRQSIEITTNAYSDSLHIGPTSSVTTTGAGVGFRVRGGMGWWSDRYTGALWGIRASANAPRDDVHVMEAY